MNSKYSDNLLKSYSSSPNSHQFKTKKITPHKRALIAQGLPVNFTDNNGTTGSIFLSDNGTLVCKYKQVCGVDNSMSSSLVDACDKRLKDCIIVVSL